MFGTLIVPILQLPGFTLSSIFKKNDSKNNSIEKETTALILGNSPGTFIGLALELAGAGLAHTTKPWSSIERKQLYTTSRSDEAIMWQ